MAERKVIGFKKFSDMKKSDSKDMEEVSPSILPEGDSTRPMNPNLPKFNGIDNPFYLWNLKNKG